MTLPSNLQVLSDYFLLPVKVLSWDKDQAVIVVPGKREHQVKTALEKLKAEKKIDQGSIQYKFRSPGVVYRKYQKH